MHCSTIVAPALLSEGFWCFAQLRVKKYAKTKLSTCRAGTSGKKLLDQIVCIFVHVQVAFYISFLVAVSSPFAHIGTSQSCSALRKIGKSAIECVCERPCMCTNPKQNAGWQSPKKREGGRRCVWCWGFPPSFWGTRQMHFECNTSTIVLWMARALFFVQSQHVCFCPAAHGKMLSHF